MSLGESAPSERRGARVIEWFLRREAIERAGKETPLDGRQLDRLALACALTELDAQVGPLVRDPHEDEGDHADPRAGALASLTLWRGVVLLALHAMGDSDHGSIEEGLDGLGAARVGSALGRPLDDGVRAALVRAMGHDASCTLKALRADLSAVSAVGRALVGALVRRRGALRRARVQRATRLGIGLVLTVALPIFAVRAVAAMVLGLAHPEVGGAAVWRASSALPEANMPRLGVGHGSDPFFFHTKAERSPWIEYDLGRPQPVSMVVVVNRSDCCRERALPLSVEVSLDASTWQEMARRDEDFSEWRASFRSTEARYVRLIERSENPLHLARVEIRR